MSCSQDQSVKVIIHKPNDDDSTTRQQTEANGRHHSYSCPQELPRLKDTLAVYVESRPRSATLDSGIGLVESSPNYAHDNTENDQVCKAADSPDSTVTFPTSIQLSQPLSILIYNNNNHQIMAGNDNGQIYVWDDTEECLVKTLKVAGKVASLDIWNDFLAVGSGAIQLINMSDTSKRVLYMKRNQRVMVSKDTKFLVSFLGNAGHLLSARFRGNTLDLWPPPQGDSAIVMKPVSTITLDDEAILSLTSSKQSKCVAVITQSDSGRGLLRLFGEGLKPLIVHKPKCLSRDANDVHVCFLTTNCLQKPNIAVGKEKTLEILEFDTSNVLHTCSTFAHTISCLSPTICNISKDSKQNMVVGTSGGDVIVFDENLNQKSVYNHSSGIVSTATTSSKKAVVYAVDTMGTLQVWNDERESQECNILIGKQLCGEGILMGRQLIQLNRQDFSPCDDSIHLHFPPEALNNSPQFLEVAFGFCGPCDLPKNMIPVSPILWLCTCPPRKFTQPVRITIPHCVDCTSAEISRLFHVMKAEHDSIRTDENGQTVIKFKEVDIKSDFPVESHQGTLEDHHFCIYCLSIYVDQQELLGNINYCLTIMKPKSYPKNEIRKIYCILHYNLDTCKKLVQNQKPQDYDMTVIMLKFTSGRYESAIEIKLDTDKAEQNGWLITMDSDTKIFAEDVNFFNYRECTMLREACETTEIDKAYPHTYPPRFVIEVSCDESSQSSKLGLEFIGAQKQPLLRDVQLIREEDVLNEYCLIIMKPKEYPKQKTCNIYCILYHDFDPFSSKKLLSDQEAENYNVSLFKMRFTKSAAIEMKLEKTLAVNSGWMITMESHSLIFAKDIGILQDAGGTYSANSAYVLSTLSAYSAKFVIEISSREACGSSAIKLEFTGGKPQNLCTEIQLHYPIAQTALQVLDVNSGSDGEAMRQDPCKPFVTLNGYVRPDH